MRGFVAVILSAVFMLVLGVGVDAADLYVSPAGDDSTGEGSVANPWRSIQYAVDQASPGDVVLVMDDDDERTDDYVENVRVDRRVTIERYDDTGPNPQVAASDTSTHVFYVFSDSVTIRGLDVYGARRDTTTGIEPAGIFLDWVIDCLIQDNRSGWDAAHGNFFGIAMVISSDNTISGNTCSNNAWGIVLNASTDNTISDNICNTNDQIGIFLLDASDTNMVSDNTCNSNVTFYGICLSASSENTASGNTCDLNGDTGIFLYESSNATVSDNVCTENGAIGLYMGSSSGNTVSDNACDLNGDTGIFLYESSGNAVSGNTCAANDDDGLYVWLSNGNTISGNTCDGNKDDGLYIRSSSGNVLSCNTCVSNGEDGIDLNESPQNNIVGNVCRLNMDDGIDLGLSSSENSIWSNMCEANSYGIALDASNDNIICLNSFIDNTVVQIYSKVSLNTWYSPVKLAYLYGDSSQTYKRTMGNYYSDYGGSDGDADGIGSDAYDLPADESMDAYPLMVPADGYNLQVWYLADPIMYRGDGCTGGAIVHIAPGASEIWVADRPAQTAIAFGAGDQSDSTGWTGGIAFAPGSDVLDDVTVEVGYVDDSAGANFWEDGPEAVLNGSDGHAFYVADARPFTVPRRRYLALRVTNHADSTHSIRGGGSWSFVSASQGSPDYALPAVAPVDAAGEEIQGLFGDDRTVGLDDFLMFVGVYGRSSGQEESVAEYDLDGSGTVGLGDFLVFAANYGKVAVNY